MGINLRQELIDLLESEGLGRKGLLRKTSGTAPVAPGGEFDPSDSRYWAGRNYVDYEITYYKTETMSAELKGVFGPLELDDEVIFIAVDVDGPNPTPHDAIVELKHSLDGVVFEKDGAGTKTFVMKGLIAINSVLEYWGDNDGAMVFYAVSSTRNRSGWAGRA